MKRLLRNPRLLSAALALFALIATFGVFSGASFATSALMDRDLRFFDPYREPSIDEAMVLCAMEHAVDADEPNDVVFLGGSSCRCDIDPRQLPMVGYNLGSHAGLQPKAILLTLKGYLAHHPAPKLVALCLSPISFDFRDDDEWATGMTGRFVADYGGTLGESVPAIETAERFVRRGFGQLATSRKTDLRDISLRGYESETYWTYRRKVSDGRGFFAIGNGRNKDCRLPNLGLDFSVSPRWSQLVRGLDQECEARGSRLLVLFTPVCRELATSRDMTEANRWFAQVAADNPRVVANGSAIWSMDGDCMFDAVHLNAAGVARFMPIVARQVDAALHGQGPK